MADGARNMMVKLVAAALAGAGVIAIAPTAAGLLPDGLNPFGPKQTVESPATPVAGGAGLAAAQPVRRVPATKGDAIASYAPVVEDTAPAVVNVYARSVQRGRVAVDPFWGAFRIPDRASQSQGSGVIVRADGVVVTNNHVVEGATELMVALGDRRQFPATVVLTDPRTDLAVLRIDTGGEQLPALAFADTTQARVGDQVLAIGNPFGVGQTVTGGIISALARTDVGITDYAFFIQTDASINPGNSGGALVDMNGALVGVNTAIFSRSGTSAGVGFAIPAEMVRRVVEGALADGRVVRAWTGVRGQTVDADMARTLGLERPGGVLVAEVWPGSAAADAGLQRGDVILTLGGVSVADSSGLRYLAATKAPGQEVTFGVRRRNADLQLTGRLSPPPGEARPEPTALSARNSFNGAAVAALNPAMAEELGLDPFLRGIAIVQIGRGSQAQRAGFQPGDVVLDVNGEPVTTLDELTGSFADGRQGEVTIQRGDQRISAVLFL
ncbi:MAG: Do family serine endopeptidase [Hyphomonadaceae bacterium]|nr:Do family serine endopeptidase [Hyphomonadaceae bacterium]